MSGRAVRPFAPVAVLLAAALGTPSVWAQQPASAPPGEPLFRAGTGVVTVDVVVRDDEGRPVTSLTAEHFTILEDDVAQTIASFLPPAAASGGSTREERRAPAAAAAAPAAPGLVALVYDRLSSQGRAMAYRASLDYLGETPTLAQTIGVFFLDLRLERLADFTRDRGRVAAAVRAAASRASLLLGPRYPGSQAEGDAESALARADSGQSVPDAFHVLDRDQVGFRTMDSLRQLVGSLALVPGRKSVVLFSEGLPLSVNVLPRYQALLAEANRANVTFYAIDAAGLRAVSVERGTALDVRGLATVAEQVSTGESRGSALGALERNADALLGDATASLGQLTLETGGFVVQHTNDLSAGFHRIGEDLDSHYVLTYAPTNDASDGTYRRIGVRVSKPGLQVTSRRGYVATPNANVPPVLTFEAQALAMLDRTPVPNDFPHAVRVVRVPSPEGRMALAILAEVDTRHFEYGTTGTPDGKRYAADAIVATRVRDLRGQVVAKSSEAYALTGDAARLEAARAGRVLFFRAPEVAPDAYTVETVVHDVRSGASSVRFASVDVARVPAGAPDVGDVFLVADAEPIADGSGRDDHPLRFGTALLYPQVGPTVDVGTRRELAFAFALANAAAVHAARVEIWQGSAPLGTVPLVLDAPDASGMVRQMFRLPVGALPVGSFEVRLVVEATNGAVLTRVSKVQTRT